MSKNWIHRGNVETLGPPRPAVDWDWRRAYPIGSIVRLAEYDTETGWHWKTYEVVRYFPHIVHCRDTNGFNRGFGNWEFQRRQKGMLHDARGAAGRWEAKEVIEANFRRAVSNRRSGRDSSVSHGGDRSPAV